MNSRLLNSIIFFVRFTTAAIFAFVTLFAISHYFYGVDYLEAAITYHMSRFELDFCSSENNTHGVLRLDHRHNFSPHFLEIYLAGDVHIGSMKYIIFLTSTLPQVNIVDSIPIL